MVLQRFFGLNTIQVTPCRSQNDNPNDHLMTPRWFHMAQRWLNNDIPMIQTWTIADRASLLDDQKLTPLIQKWTSDGPKMTQRSPKMVQALSKMALQDFWRTMRIRRKSQIERQRAEVRVARLAVDKAYFLQLHPGIKRRTKILSGWRWLKVAPRWHSIASGWPQDGSTYPQDGQRWLTR